MLRLICGLVLVLLIVTPSLGQQSLVGTYKLVDYALEIDGTPRKAPGKAAHGYYILTPTRAIQFYTLGDRKFGTSVEEKAALFDTLVAYSGVYRVEGDKIIYTYDASWTENLNGTTAVLKWQLSGNRLTVTTEPRPWPVDPSKTIVVRRVWEKIE
jgi:hypothetical protein